MAINIFSPANLTNLGDPNRQQRSYDRQKGYSQDRADVQAGRKLAGGDYQGAASDLYGSGQLEQGQAAQNYGQAQDDRAQLQQKTKSAETAKGILTVLQAAKQQPEAARMGFVQSAAPLFEKLGIPRDAIASVTPEYLTDQSLNALIGKAQEALEIVNRGNGAYDVVGKETGRVVRSVAPNPTYQTLGPDQSLVQLGGQGGGQPAPQGGAQPPTDDLFGALVMQESGGRAGVLGPQTQYGQAEGMTQMLPATAQSMANKLGVQWRPELMRGTSDEAAQYQQQLGRAYFDEGLQKYGGDPVKALMYYHGGPNEALWGPKTQAYARQVMARVQPYEQAQAGGVAAAPSGPTTGSGARVIAQGAPKPVERWEDLPGGGQRNMVTNQTQNVPKSSGRLPATVIKLQTDLLTDLKTASTLNSTIRRTINQIDGGGLNLSLVGNIFAAGRNMAGVSDQNSRNYETFKTGLEKMRNDSLRLNKGVQTDSDAKRAWDEIIQNPNDEKLVRQRLAEIMDLNEQAIALRKDLVAQAREDSGFEPLDTSRYEAPPVVNDPGSAKKPAAKAGGRAPAAAVSYLRGNNTPQMRQAFDAKYGAGASARVLAGR